jgi:polyisoprenoid-binding protein YceI
METTLTKTKWTLDKTHSEIQFKAKHLMITTVTGNLVSYEAEIETAGSDFSSVSVQFTGDVKSLTTHNEQRDGHLQGDDFFSSDKFPKLVFSSASVSKNSDTEFILKGNLTIRDVTKPVSLKVEFGGITKDPWGNTRAGLHFETKINRKDFGLKFHVLNETGNLLVSDDIKIEGEIQLVQATN